MPRALRSIVIDEESVGTFHCTQRCVRRSSLCGEDSVSAQSSGRPNHRGGPIIGASPIIGAQSSGPASILVGPNHRGQPQFLLTNQKLFG